MSQGDRRAPDYYLLFLTLVLLGAGMVVLYSASSIWAYQKFKDPAYFLKKQLLWAAIGTLSLYAFSRMDYNRLKEWIKPALIMTWVLLVAVLFTMPVGGARRWIRLGPVGIQPVEAAKLCLIVYLADFLDRRRSKARSLREGLLPPLLVVAATLAPILLEPDLGNPVLLAAVAGLMLLVGGASPFQLGLAGMALLPLAAYEVLKYPYRRARFLSFLSPFGDLQGVGYQLAQSLMAVGSGGWFGKGLGSSNLKLMYLPSPHTDFIFPVLCEELGLVGGLGVLALFTLFLARGFKVARSAPNLFGCLLATGLTLVLTLQAFLNIAVSVGLLPTKGLPLPFFSAGGSSMVVTLTAVGILLNISRQAKSRSEIIIESAQR